MVWSMIGLVRHKTLMLSILTSWIQTTGLRFCTLILIQVPC